MRERCRNAERALHASASHHLGRDRAHRAPPAKPPYRRSAGRGERVACPGYGRHQHDVLSAAHPRGVASSQVTVPRSSARPPPALLLVLAGASPLADPGPPPGSFPRPAREHDDLVVLVEHDVVDHRPVDSTRTQRPSVHRPVLRPPGPRRQTTGCGGSPASGCRAPSGRRRARVPPPNGGRGSGKDIGRVTVGYLGQVDPTSCSQQRSRPFIHFNSRSNGSNGGDIL
jgi:hypothetical protein